VPGRHRGGHSRLRVRQRARGRGQRHHAVCAPGDHVVIPDDAYGGTLRLFTRVFERWGVTVTPAPLGDPAAVRAAIRPETRLIWCETPTNPLLGITDIAALAAVAHEAGALLAVDNTFASP
jgi:cystathionine gamma-synthase